MSGSLPVVSPPLRSAAALGSPELTPCFTRKSRAALSWGALGLVALLFAWTGIAAEQGGTSDSLSPQVTGFTPDSGAPGTLVIIHGSNLLEVVSIQFAGVTAPVYGAVDDGTAVQTQVPANATSGPITVVTAHGTASSASDFQVVALKPPVISSFSPGQGSIGTEVSFEGSDLVHVRGVSFNGIDALYSTLVGLTAFVPTNATTGPITVWTSQGSFTTTEAFTVTAVGAPVLTAFNPTSGPPGTIVTLTGTNFEGVTNVLFGDVSSPSTTIMADQVWAEVPPDAHTAPITIQTQTGQATSQEAFVVTAVPTPVIFSLSPTSARPGEYVLIHGTNLNFVGRVTVHDVPADVSVLSPGELSMLVPYAPSGRVAVETPGGTAVSPEILTVIGGPSAPAILSFSPTNGLAGTRVTLHGADLGVVQAVLFDGFQAEFARQDNDVIAVVPELARSGPITVKTSLGTATTADAFETFNTGELRLALKGSPDSAQWNQPITFTLLMTNLSSGTLHGLIVTNLFHAGTNTADDLLLWVDGRPAFSDLAPANIEIKEARTTQGTAMVTNGAVIGLMGELPPGGSIELTMVVAALEPQKLHCLNLTDATQAEGATVTAGALTTVWLTGTVPLTLTSLATGQLQIAWPVSSETLVLQSADAARASAEWHDVTAPIEVIDGRNLARVEATLGCQFFRLVQKAP